MKLKAVQILVNSVLPPDLRDYQRDLSAKGVGQLMLEVARRYPEKYTEISDKITSLGRNSSYFRGETFRLNDLRPVFDKEAVFAQMDAELDQLKKTAKNQDELKKGREAIWQKYSSSMEKLTMKNSLDQGNNLGYAILSGSRGNPGQLKSMITTPGTYSDYKGNIVPLFIRNSFSEGLRPAEYLAGSFGARLSVISTKSSTSKGGDLGKQFVQSAANLVVTEKDCGVNNGIDLEPDDHSLKNRVLSKPVGELKAGTVLDKQALAYIHKVKPAAVVVRSALTCQAGDGVCAKCLGVQANGRFPHIGEAVGITASQALAEPITQGALSAKHAGGQTKEKKDFSGFQYINQFVQSPESYPDRAAVAEHDGIVESVEDAPQGGMFIRVSGTQHYILPGFNPTVKPGQKVEAGEQLSDGLIDAADIVRLRGLGEGRRYYAERLKKLLDDSGLAADRRNTEMLARATIDHIQVEDPDQLDGMEDVLPDDVLGYSAFQHRYVPPDNTKRGAPSSVVGQYMQSPALHYSIGTRVTPSIATRLEKSGFNEVYVSPDAPAFKPQMANLRTAAHNMPDWLAKTHTSYLKSNLHDSAVRGELTDVNANTHFGPRLAYGKDFGKKVTETGKF